MYKRTVVDRQDAWERDDCAGTKGVDRTCNNSEVARGPREQLVTATSMGGQAGQGEEGRTPGSILERDASGRHDMGGMNP